MLSINRNSPFSLKDQICAAIVEKIHSGALSANQKMPSCRTLANQLGTSRNTVFNAYTQLVDLGLLSAIDRSRFLVSETETSGLAEKQAGTVRVNRKASSRISETVIGRHSPPVSQMARVNHPADWAEYPFAFIYNQIDPKLFPLADWRECSRQAMNTVELRNWTADTGATESTGLTNEIRSRLLTRRGIFASNDQILVTSGAQGALYILGVLFGRAGLTIGVEDPGYPEARNAFQLAGLGIRPVPLDGSGVSIDTIPTDVDLLYTTPSHQFPTTVTMPIERRKALLEAANNQDLYLIEDDYEAEMNYRKDPSPSLRSMDSSGRVIYVGSLSKPISPSLRLGFIVAEKPIIDEARAIHRTISRQTSLITQSTAARFLKLGFFDTHINRLHKSYRKKWHEMKSALDDFLPGLNVTTTEGGTCFWLKCPAGVRSSILADNLKERGVLIDAAGPFFLEPTRGESFFRLGFAAVPVRRIRTGIRMIAEELDRPVPRTEPSC